ncbi:MAG: ATPase domain-containing protein [Thermoplasmata archaeon]
MIGKIFSIEIPRDGLHRRLGGGIPVGTITAIAGKHGSGKSAVVQRILYGLLKNNYNVTYISTELTTKGLIDQMESLDYQIIEYLTSRHLLFIPVFPLIGKSIPRKDFLTRLMAARKLFETDVCIIDTFSALVKDQLTPETAIEAMAFFKKIVAGGKAVVLTFESGELTKEVENAIFSAVDILIEIEKSYGEGEIQRVMTITRYTNAQDYVGSVIGFRVEAKRGIIVDITTVA